MMINQQKCGGALEQMDSRGKKHYIYWMFAIFGAVTMSILLFFIIYRYREFSDSIAKLMGIASPLIYGAAIAYLLKPICNFYERKLRELLSEKHKKLANMLAVAGSMLTAFIIIYLLLMIIIPQVGNSISRLVQTVPEKLNQASVWMENNLDKDFGLPHYLTEIGIYRRNVLNFYDSCIIRITQGILINKRNVILDAEGYRKNVFYFHGLSVQFPRLPVWHHSYNAECFLV